MGSTSGRPVGVWLRLADMAARHALHRAARGAHPRLAPRPEDVEPCQPRHARMSRPCFLLAVRRQLPRRGPARGARTGAAGAARPVAARDAAAGPLPVYTPRWLPCHTIQGTAQDTVQALAFTLSRRSPHYTGILSDAQYRHILAHARGTYGTTLDYAQATYDELLRLGIRDGALGRVLTLNTA